MSTEYSGTVKICGQEVSGKYQKSDPQPPSNTNVAAQSSSDDGKCTAITWDGDKGSAAQSEGKNSKATANKI